MKKICIDTGVITLLFDKEPPKSIIDLFSLIKNKKIQADVPKEILIEVYFQLSRLKGKDFATSRIMYLIENYGINLVDLDISHIIKAGQLKIENPKFLSYNDCIGMAHSILEKIEFHTTEKNLKSKPRPEIQNLKVKKYSFD